MKISHHQMVRFSARHFSQPVIALFVRGSQRLLALPRQADAGLKRLSVNLLN
jgi:hypothetical protein